MNLRHINNKHPRGLTTIFFTEMWERFSYYGMRALLTLYLTLQLFRDIQDPLKKTKAFGIYAAYCALVYATPFIGGLLADRFLGFKKAVLFGAVMMAIGHFVMAVENEFMLYIALAFLIIGNGFFKPNMSSMVGGLYHENDPRRDSGYTIFYMGINIGALLAPIVCGAIGEQYGWHYGFGLAGIGMLSGLLIFEKNKFKLGSNGDPPNFNLLKRRLLWIRFEWIIYLTAIISVGFVALLVHYYETISYILFPLIVFFISVIIIKALKSEQIARERLWVVLILLIFSTLFWAFFEQAGSSLTLFANENVDRNMLGMQLPASLFQSVNPFFIIVLAPLFSMLWLFLANRSLEPSIPKKFAYALLQVGIGFLVLVLGAEFTSIKTVVTDTGSQPLLFKAAVVPVFFLIVAYFFHTTGELCLSPIGLSMVTKLSPKNITGMVMGAWFLSSALAHHSAGFIAGMTTDKKYISPKQTAINESINYLSNKNKSVNFDDVSIELLLTELEPAINKGIEYIRQENNTLLLQDSLILKSRITANAVDSAVAVFDRNVLLQMEKGIRTKQADSIFICAFKGTASVILSNTKKARHDVIQAGIKTEGTLSSYPVEAILSYGNLVHYMKVFRSIGWIAIAASVFLFFLSPRIRKMMHGIH